MKTVGSSPYAQRLKHDAHGSIHDLRSGTPTTLESEPAAEEYEQSSLQRQAPDHERFVFVGRVNLATRAAALKVYFQYYGKCEVMLPTKQDGTIRGFA